MAPEVIGSIPILLPICTDDGMVDKPVSGTGAQKACGFESRSVHHIDLKLYLNDRQQII